VHRPEELIQNQNEDLDNPRLEQAWAGKVRDSSDFLVARDGDHLLVPFECDRCIFLKLRGCLPDTRSSCDQLLLATIRRMNLDAFWSRETSTVLSNLRKAKKMIEVSQLVGLTGPFPLQPPLPLKDHCGYQVAIDMLLLSRRPGRHDEAYTQYDTVRSYRATYSNFVRSSSENNKITYSLGDFNGNYQRITHDICASLFFKRFTEGMKSRMGQICKPNLALSIPLLKLLLRKLELKFRDAETMEDKHLFLSILSYVAISYTLSLRGPEGFMIDLHGLVKYKNKTPEYCIVTLLGRLKGEAHDLTHLIPCANVTDSGIQIRSIINTLITFKVSQGFSSGPAISNYEGKLLSAKSVDDVLHEILIDLFLQTENLFPLSVDVPDKVRVSYQCFRTFRRTSTTRATEKGVSATDVNVVNKWAPEAKGKSKPSSEGMHQHYTQIELLVRPFLRYTKAM